MRRMLLVVGLLATASVADQGPQKKPETPAFRLPDDPAGQLLARALTPTARPGPLPLSGRPRPVAGPPPRGAEPSLPPRPTTVLPRLSAPPPRPGLPPDYRPDETLRESLPPPDVPARPTLAVGRPVRVDRIDPSLPPPLPVSARPVPDRAPLDDATQPASKAAALSATPRRTTAVPFGRERVPDPDANRLPLTSPLPPEPTAPVSPPPPLAPRLSALAT